MQDIQQTVARAFTIVDEITALLEKSADCAVRAQALAAYRAQHAETLAQLTSDLRQHSLETLRPVIQAEQAQHPRAGQAFRLAMDCAKDPAFAAEWSAISELLGGPR